MLVSAIIIKGERKAFPPSHFYYVTSNDEISIKKKSCNNKKKKYNKGNVLIPYFIKKYMDTLPVFH